MMSFHLNYWIQTCSSMTAHKETSRKTLFDEVGVHELDWPEQIPDPISTELHWDELECRLHSSLARITLVPDLTNG